MKELSVRDTVRLRIGDLLAVSEKRRKPGFTAFLNESEQHYASEFLKEQSVDFCFWGGSESCTRRMLCVFPQNGKENFPIYSLTFTFRSADSLSHRDFLGSFLSMGINRDQIGDILTADGYAVVFCTKTAYSLISELKKIGRTGVTVNDGIIRAVPELRFTEQSAVVASLRIDCIVSAVSGLSREKSADYIKSGHFMLNYEVCTNVSKLICVGDILTMRGYGKFVLADGGTETKKGRLRI